MDVFLFLLSALGIHKSGSTVEVSRNLCSLALCAPGPVSAIRAFFNSSCPFYFSSATGEAAAAATTTTTHSADRSTVRL